MNIFVFVLKPQMLTVKSRLLNENTDFLTALYFGWQALGRQGIIIYADFLPTTKKFKISGTVFFQFMFIPTSINYSTYMRGCDWPKERHGQVGFKFRVSCFLSGF